MLSYKEYKLLNESLYGAFNLGLKSPNVVAGVVTSSPINGTEAAIEAEAEEAIEEAKKMKKKMDCGSEKEVEDEESEEDSEVSDEESEDEDMEDEEESEDEDMEDEEESEKEPKFMKKKMLKGDQHKLDKNKNGKIDSEDFNMLKKKSKKEWSEIVSDLESLLEDISDEGALAEIKKGLETIKEGMKKGCGVKKCGKMMSKNCGKYMNEEEQAWWNSVNGMLSANPDQRNWDGGWSEVGEVQQAVRENTEK